VFQADGRKCSYGYRLKISQPSLDHPHIQQGLAPDSRKFSYIYRLRISHPGLDHSHVQQGLAQEPIDADDTHTAGLANAPADVSPGSGQAGAQGGEELAS
jgi:hypothetical protein